MFVFLLLAALAAVEPDDFDTEPNQSQEVFGECKPRLYPGKLCGTSDVGQCKYGQLVLWDDVAVVYEYEDDKYTCVGASYPMAEVPDGVDNNCNGIIDDIAEDPDNFLSFLGLILALIAALILFNLFRYNVSKV